MTPELIDTYRDLQSAINAFPEGTEMYFLRHGQTKNNLERIAQGAACTSVPLNLTGINQAHDIGKKLDMTTFDLTFTSPAVRAKQTFEIARNYFISKGNEYELESLQEIAWGDNIDGKPMDEAYENINNKFFTEKQFNYREAGSENLNDVLRRCITALGEMSNILYEKLQDNKISQEPTILVTGHGFYFGLLLTTIIDSKLGLKQKPENGGCKILTFGARGNHKLTKL